MLAHRMRSVFIFNATAQAVKQTLLGFAGRYRNYRSGHLPGVWECKTLKSQQNQLRLQLIDRIYEPRRGIQSSESGVFCIDLTPRNNGVDLSYQYKEQPYVCALCSLWGAMTLAMLFLALDFFFAAHRLGAGILMSCNFCFLMGISVFWLIRRRKHNKLTLAVFGEILQKNFEYCIES